ncbi:hypothetical protein DXG01_003225 [Tephrocybe rancida]|nr:hypothetical protein DXG01_003225 [Tephrocybe rancida]
MHSYEDDSISDLGYEFGNPAPQLWTRHSLPSGHSAYCGINLSDQEWLEHLQKVHNIRPTDPVVHIPSRPFFYLDDDEFKLGFDRLPHLAFPHTPVGTTKGNDLRTPRILPADLFRLWPSAPEEVFNNPYTRSMVDDSSDVSHSAMPLPETTIPAFSSATSNKRAAKAATSGISTSGTTGARTPRPTNASTSTLPKPFRCPKPRCNKSFNYANGLRYHITHGSCNFPPAEERDAGPPASESPSLHHDTVTSDPSHLGDDERHLRPFACGVANCQRRYKSVKELMDHFRHSEHGANGLTRFLKKGKDISKEREEYSSMMAATLPKAKRDGFRAPPPTPMSTSVAYPSNLSALSIDIESSFMPGSTALDINMNSSIGAAVQQDQQRHGDTQNSAANATGILTETMNDQAHQSEQGIAYASCAGDSSPPHPTPSTRTPKPEQGQSTAINPDAPMPAHPGVPPSSRDDSLRISNTASPTREGLCSPEVDDVAALNSFSTTITTANIDISASSLALTPAIDSPSLPATPVPSSEIRPSPPQHPIIDIHQHQTTAVSSSGIELTSDSKHEVSPDPDAQFPGQRVISTLIAILNEPERYQQLLRCTGTEAQVILDTCQVLLDSHNLASNARWQIVTAMQRLSGKTGAYPSKFFLRSRISLAGEDAVSSGGYGDIYKAIVHNYEEALCLKVLRANQWMLEKITKANVLVDRSGRAYLADFGLSNVDDPLIAHWTSQSSVASKGGSTRWQAPELHQINSENDSEEALTVHNTEMSDVFAWACLCFEIFTGHIPFHNIHSATTVAIRIVQGSVPSKPKVLQHGLNESIWELMEQCWKYEPRARPDISAIVKRLRREVNQDPRPAPQWPEGSALRFRMWESGISGLELETSGQHEPGLNEFEAILSRLTEPVTAIRSSSPEEPTIAFLKEEYARRYEIYHADRLHTDEEIPEPPTAPWTVEPYPEYTMAQRDAWYESALDFFWESKIEREWSEWLETVYHKYIPRDLEEEDRIRIQQFETCPHVEEFYQRQNRDQGSVARL